MDPQVGASFIPKKPLAEVRGSGGGASGLLFVIALLIFIASIVAAGAAFLYIRYLDVSLASKKDSLAKYQQAYDLATIQTLVRFDSRINEAQKVLAAHLAPSTIFDFLSQQTLEKVQFTNFDYTYGSDGKVAIQMSGVADSFSTIALQSDQFSANRVLQDVIFSNITVGTDGKVGFDVKANIDPSFILYSSSLTATPGSIPADTDTTGSTTTQ